MFVDYVKNEIKKARLANIEDVRKNINSVEVQTKIANHIQRYGEDIVGTPAEIAEKIMTDNLSASMFAKDPLKQNITEKIVGKYLGLDKMPASGKNCVRFDKDGKIVSTKTASASKSADFKIGEYYFTQKYTGNNTGGAQDNQFNDVVDFLTKGSINYKVGALVDGEYWDQMGNKKKLIDAFADNDNVKVLSADEIKAGGIDFEN